MASPSPDQNGSLLDRPPEEWLGFQLNALASRMRARTYAELAMFGFPHRALGLMPAMATATDGDGNQTSLAARLSMDRTTISALVDTLVCAGLVTRVPDVRDRRNNRLSLTDEGKRKLEIACQHAAAVEQEVLAPLSAQERQLLSSLLTTLMAADRQACRAAGED